MNQESTFDKSLYSTVIKAHMLPDPYYYNFLMQGVKNVKVCIVFFKYFE